MVQRTSFSPSLSPGRRLIPLNFSQPRGADGRLQLSPQLPYRCNTTTTTHTTPINATLKATISSPATRWDPPHTHTRAAANSASARGGGAGGGNNDEVGASNNTASNVTHGAAGGGAATQQSNFGLHPHRATRAANGPPPSLNPPQILHRHTRSTNDLTRSQLGFFPRLHSPAQTRGRAYGQEMNQRFKGSAAFSGNSTRNATPLGIKARGISPMITTPMLIHREPNIQDNSAANAGDPSISAGRKGSPEVRGITRVPNQITRLSHNPGETGPSPRQFRRPSNTQLKFEVGPPSAQKYPNMMPPPSTSRKNHPQGLNTDPPNEYEVQMSGLRSSLLNHIADVQKEICRLQVERKKAKDNVTIYSNMSQIRGEGRGQRATPSSLSRSSTARNDRPDALEVMDNNRAFPLNLSALGHTLEQHHSSSNAHLDALAAATAAAAQASAGNNPMMLGAYNPLSSPPHTHGGAGGHNGETTGCGGARDDLPSSTTESQTVSSLTNTDKTPFTNDEDKKESYPRHRSESARQLHDPKMHSALGCTVGGQMQICSARFNMTFDNNACSASLGERARAASQQPPPKFESPGLLGIPGMMNMKSFPSPALASHMDRRNSLPAHMLGSSSLSQAQGRGIDPNLRNLLSNRPHTADGNRPAGSDSIAPTAQQQQQQQQQQKQQEQMLQHQLQQQQLQRQQQLKQEQLQRLQQQQQQQKAQEKEQEKAEEEQAQEQEHKKTKQEQERKQRQEQEHAAHMQQEKEKEEAQKAQLASAAEEEARAALNHHCLLDQKTLDAAVGRAPTEASVAAVSNIVDSTRSENTNHSSHTNTHSKSNGIRHHNNGSRGMGRSSEASVVRPTPHVQREARKAFKPYHWLANKIQRAWRTYCWRSRFVAYGEKLGWVGTLDWLQKHNFLYGTELAEPEDIQTWEAARKNAPLDSEVDPWGSAKLKEHLHRMWFGEPLPEPAQIVHQTSHGYNQHQSSHHRHGYNQGWPDMHESKRCHSEQPSFHRHGANDARTQSLATQQSFVHAFNPLPRREKSIGAIGLQLPMPTWKRSPSLGARQLPEVQLTGTSSFKIDAQHSPESMHINQDGSVVTDSGGSMSNRHGGGRSAGGGEQDSVSNKTASTHQFPPSSGLSSTQQFSVPLMKVNSLQQNASHRLRSSLDSQPYYQRNNSAQRTVAAMQPSPFMPSRLSNPRLPVPNNVANTHNCQTRSTPMWGSSYQFQGGKDVLVMGKCAY